MTVSRHVSSNSFTTTQSGVGILLVGTVTSFGLDGPGFEFLKVQEIFPAPKRPYWLWGPPILQSNGHHDSFPGVKRPGCAVDHSSPSSAKVKNELSYSLTPPPYACMVWTGIIQPLTIHNSVPRHHTSPGLQRR